ncbi:MAG TPA: ACT domain-containing protein [Phycisphaerae bacterium]|nr:ACT domain-containing protein [Phycisphaerae bacterium]
MLKPVTQFSVFLVNKPGILSRVCQELADKKINVVALTLMDSVEHGVFRLVAEDALKARQVLRSLNLPTTETEVLAAEMPNRPGAMADLCGRLNGEHISIKYAYVTSGAAGGRTIGIFKVDNLQKALKVAAPRKSTRREAKVSRIAPTGRGR